MSSTLDLRSTVRRRALRACGLAVLVGVACSRAGTEGATGDEPGADAATDTSASDDDAGGGRSPIGSGGPDGSGAGRDGAAAPPGQDGAVSDGGVAGDGPVDCSSLPLCDDFESDTPGMPPNPALWHVFMGCNPNATNAPVAGGGLTVGIDTSTAHSGRNALRVVGGDSCGFYAIHTAAFATLGKQVYARFYARFSGTTGAPDAGAATQNHNGFLSMYSGTTAGSDPAFYSDYNGAGATSGQLRLGFQGDAVVWNDIIASKDTTLPDIDTMGTSMSISPAADEWDCYEFHIDQTDDYIELWFNGASVPGASWTGQDVQGVSDQWFSGGPPPLQLQSLGLGWLQLNDQETAWYDDVALSDSRIGCE